MTKKKKGQGLRHFPIPLEALKNKMEVLAQEGEHEERKRKKRKRWTTASNNVGLAIKELIRGLLK